VAQVDQRNDGKKASAKLPHQIVEEVDQRNDGKKVSAKLLHQYVAQIYETNDGKKSPNLSSSPVSSPGRPK
jgi:hypothetical protein